MKKVLWIHQTRPRSAWYGLDPQQKSAFLSKWRELDAAAIASGARRDGEYSIRGQSDYSTVEIWHFDSPERAFDFWDARVQSDYAVWFAFSNQLGVALSAAGAVDAS